MPPMKRTITVGLLALLCPLHAAAQGQLEWNRTNVVAKLDNHGGVRVEETHEITLSGEVTYAYRTLLVGADQSAVVQAVSIVDSLGVKRALRNGADGPDSYQSWAWGLQIWFKAEADPPFEPSVRRSYLIEYTLRGAVTPSWDLAAGVEPLDSGTHPRSPFDRAREVLAGWKEAWPDLHRVYRFDHDVEFPTRGSPNGLPELNYRLEYDTAWVLLDKDRDIGVATPDVDYRVQRHLRYLPEGRPRDVDVEAPALRLAGVFGPFVLCLTMLGLFLMTSRLLGRPPRGDRALFERVIEPQPIELIAAKFGDSPNPPGFARFIERMAAERKLSITVEKPATDETDAKVSLRLVVPRDRLRPFERAVVQELFGYPDSVSSADIQDRFRGREFDPDLLVDRMLKPFVPQAATVTSRHGWMFLCLAFFGGGVALIVKSLVDQTLADPIPIFAGFVPGHIFAIFWPLGTPGRRVSIFTLLFAAFSFSLLGAALAISPNTPLSGFAALGLGLMSVGHYVGYLARMPKSRPEDLEFEAARRFASSELRKPRPALKDAWVESLEALGLSKAIANWRKRAGDFTAGPDMADMGLGEAQSGPPFTGEAPRPPTLPDGWAEGFYVYEDEDD